MKKSFDELANGVCYIENLGIVGSGFFMKDDLDGIWLITAKHVADKMGLNTSILYSKGDQLSNCMGLMNMCNDIDFKSHTTADISILLLKNDDKYIKKYAFTVSDLADESDISRHTLISCVGFPSGVGAKYESEEFIPITKTSYTAAPIMTLEIDALGGKQKTILVDNLIPQGMSGGPAFSHTSEGIFKICGINHSSKLNSFGAITCISYLKEIPEFTRES